MNDPTPQFTAGDVEVMKRETPFQGFFRLDRLHLRHRLFEGGWSGTMQRELFVRPPAAAVLRQGGGDPDDPQAAWLDPFPAVRDVRAVRDGAVIRLGEVAVTAHATPGHTLGSMSWSWSACEGKACRTIVFASSLNPIAADGWRFADPAHRRFVDAFRATFAKVKAMPCDMLISAHPDPGDADRLARLARLLQL